MTKTTHLLLLLTASAVVSTICSGEAGKSVNSLVAPGETVTKLADGFRFTEGPVADSNGDILFTDIPNLKRKGNSVTTWRIHSGPTDWPLTAMTTS